MLRCDNEGLPKPDITWYKENTLLLSTHKPAPSHKYHLSLNNGSLAILDLTSHDNGVYYCYASSLATFPVSSLNYTLTVTNSLLKKSQHLTVNETDTILLNCQIPDTAHVLKVTWTLNETTRLTTPAAYPAIFSISNIQLDQAGVYDCYAETNSTNYLTRLDVVVRKLPVLVEKKHRRIATTKGNSAVLDCTWWFTTTRPATGSIPANLTRWTLNGADLINDSPVPKHEFLDSYKTILRVNNLGVRDSGDVYTCRFSLEKSEVKVSEFGLFVGVAPFVVGDAAMRNNNSQVWSSGEKAVGLECLLGGLPEVDKTWYLNDQLVGERNKGLRVDSDGRLTIERLDSSLEGVYTCNASNEFGYEILRYEARLAGRWSLVVLNPDLVKMSNGYIGMYEKCS